MKKKRFSSLNERHVSCGSKSDQGVPVSVGATVKPKRFLPFLALQFKEFLHPRPQSLPLPHPPSYPLTLFLPFSLLLTAFCLLFSPSCKDIGVPPDRIIPDTTSHNFAWQIDTLGDGNSSVLNDVFIIDENNIWAVGEINLKDTLGDWINPPYNIARWNGQRWTLQTLSFVWDFGSGYASAEAIFAFGANDILVSSGGSVMHWNGSTWTNLGYLCQGSNCLGSVYGIWGKSSSDFYGIGLAGSIVHWDGMNWQKLESGTTLPLNDIWGSTNSVTRETTVLCVASNRYLNEGKKLLKISGLSAEAIPDSGLSWSISGVWFDSGSPYYVVGAGVGKKNVLDSTQWSVSSSGEITMYYTNAVRGTRSNDVVVAGAFGEILHFNGSTWRSFHSITQLPTGTFYSVSMKDNTIVAVGQVGNRAVVARGIRSE